MQHRAQEDLLNAPDEETRKQAQARLEAWSDGGANKILLHGLMGAAVAALGGENALQGMGAAAGAEAAKGVMADYLVAHGVTDKETFNALMELGSAAIGRAVGGQAGAGTALAGDRFNRQLHSDEVRFLQKKETIDSYISYMASHGIQLSEDDARRDLNRYSASSQDAHWAELNGSDALTTAFLQQVSVGRTYRDSEDNEHAFFQSSDREYKDETINLNSLYGKRFNKDIEAYLNDNKSIYSKSNAETQAWYFAGQQQGYADSDKHVSFIGDVGDFAKGALHTVASIALSGYSDRIGPIDELRLKEYYGMLLKDQGRWGEAGYVDAVDWANSNRLMWVGFAVGGAADLAASQSLAIIRAAKPKGMVVETPVTGSVGAEIPVVRINVGDAVKGSPEFDLLNNPGARAANTKYELDNGNSFKTNSAGQVEELTFTPVNTKVPRDARQTEVGKQGRDTDVGGHAQACSQGGACDGYNLFPQDRNFNNSAYKVFYENEIKSALNDPAKNVGPTTIKFSRVDPNSPRPDTLSVTYTIDGKTRTRIFENEANKIPRDK
jgi:DNA/RNA non-specific endonuclease